MILSFAKILAILKKEFIQLKRDRATAAMVIFIPLIQLLLFGYAINNDPKHLNTVVLSEDNSIFSRNFVVGLKNSEYFHVAGEIKSDAEGRKLLQKGDVQFVVTIPGNFSRDLIRRRVPSVLIEADAADPVTAAGAVGAAREILTSALARDLSGVLSFLRNDNLLPANVIIHKLYNPEGFTNYNVIPGLIGALLTLMGIMVTALSLTRERERGTMENMLAMPVKPMEVMLGKIIPHIIIGYIQAAIIVAAAKFLFTIPLAGSSFLLAIAMMMFIICNLALGLAVSTIAKNQMQSLQIAMFIFLPSLMLSGFMFPFYGMPSWAQMIGSCFPMTYFVRITRGIMLKGSNFSEMWQNFWALLLFMCIVTGIAAKLYKKTLD
ncbi:MAG: ABC transporter permease [Holosporaceae bacterium]|jgi:ABC-2 type transport system permease protein|nr:ABC transporter permease [Holosporaceae bacterium]